MEDVGIFSPRPILSSNRSKCAVEGCESKATNNLSLRFHHFPKPNARYTYTRNSSGNLMKIDHYDAWKTALNIKSVTQSTKICSLHFRKEDYILPSIETKKRFLKKTAVPTCNLPNLGVRKNIRRRKIAPLVIEGSIEYKNMEMQKKDADIDRYSIVSCLKCTKKGGGIQVVSSQNSSCPSCNTIRTTLCSKCGKNFASHNDQINHKCFKKPTLICPKCGLMFQNKHGLIMHGRVCVEPEHLECKFCERKFLIINEYKTHLRTMHLRNIKRADLDKLVDIEVDARNERFAQKKKKFLNKNTNVINAASFYNKEVKIQQISDIGGDRNKIIDNFVEIKNEVDIESNAIGPSMTYELKSINIESKNHESHKTNGFEYKNIKENMYQEIDDFGNEINLDNEELIIGI